MQATYSDLFFQTHNHVPTARHTSAKPAFFLSLFFLAFQLLAAPAAFDLVAPKNAWVPNGYPIFTWQASTGAVSYEVWIDGVKRPEVITATTFRPATAITNGFHTWMVVAVGAASQGSTNSTSTFEFFIASRVVHPWEATDGFESNDLSGYVSSGIAVTGTTPLNGTYSLQTTQANSPSYSYACDPGISMEDEEACVSVLMSFVNKTSRAGVGFALKNGNWVYAMVLPNLGRIAIYQRSSYSYTTMIPTADRPAGTWSETQVDGFNIWYIADKASGTINTNTKYRLKVFFSRRSRCILTKLEDANGNLLVQDRVTGRVLETPEHPLLVAISTAVGAVMFDDFTIKYPVDKWVLPWKPTPARVNPAVNQCPSDPVLIPRPGQVNYPCGPSNPQVWKWQSADGKIWHMIARCLGGGGTGVVHSLNGIAGWDSIYFATSFPWVDDVVSCHDPANGRILFLNGGHGNWQYSTPALNFSTWNNVPGWSATSGLANALKGEVIDVQNYPGKLQPVNYNGTNYRYISFDEQYMTPPQSYLAFSNDLQTWVERRTELLPSRAYMWSNQGRPCGGSFVMPDGNIMVLYCGCTDLGYVGADDAGWNALIVSGTQPWTIVQEGEAGLPIFPTYPGHKQGCNEGGTRSWDPLVYHTGPMFATCIVRDTVSGVEQLRLYGGVNDQCVALLTASMAPNYQYYFLKVKGVTTSGATVACTLNVNVRNIGPTTGSQQVSVTVDGTVQNFMTLTLSPFQDTTVQIVVTGPASALHVVRAGSSNAVAFGTGAVGIRNNGYLNGAAVNGRRYGTIKIYDLNGRLLSVRSEAEVINAKELARTLGKGIYLLQHSWQGKAVFTKIVADLK